MPPIGQMVSGGITVEPFQIVAGIIGFLFASGILYGVIQCTLYIADIRNEAKEGTMAANRAATSAEKMEQRLEHLDDIVVRHDYTLKAHREEMNRIWKRLPKSDTFVTRPDHGPPPPHKNTTTE